MTKSLQVSTNVKQTTTSLDNVNLNVNKSNSPMSFHSKPIQLPEELIKYQSNRLARLVSELIGTDENSAHALIVQELSSLRSFLRELSDQAYQSGIEQGRGEAEKKIKKTKYAIKVIDDAELEQTLKSFSKLGAWYEGYQFAYYEILEALSTSNKEEV